jgi:hypothetical protein
MEEKPRWTKNSNGSTKDMYNRENEIAKIKKTGFPTEADFQECKDILKIESVVRHPTYSKLCGDIEESDANFYCACPFCANIPIRSFWINKELQIFYCSICHLSGDIVSFISKIKECSPVLACEFVHQFKDPLKFLDFDLLVGKRLN